jgi:nucleotide-binding universal stress UspA family protein
MTAITRILVPVDFSDHADRALGYALTLAKSFGACVELLHVVEDPFAAGGWGSEVYIPDLDGLRRRAIEDASKQLDACRSAILGEGVPVVATVLMGAVAQTIVEYATADAANLIVMGTHGRTGLAHLILGSVAERVVRKAPCPVLTVGTSDVTRDVHAAA